MINKDVYTSLLKQKDFNSIINQFKTDFIILFKEMLDYKNIKYDNIEYIDYYILLCQENYRDLNTELLLLKNLFTLGDIENIDKVDNLLTIYSNISNKYKSL